MRGCHIQHDAGDFERWSDRVSLDRSQSLASRSRFTSPQQQHRRNVRRLLRHRQLYHTCTRSHGSSERSQHHRGLESCLKGPEGLYNSMHFRNSFHIRRPSINSLPKWLGRFGPISNFVVTRLISPQHPSPPSSA